MYVQVVTGPIRRYNETNLWFKRVQQSAALTKTFEILRMILKNVLYIQHTHNYIYHTNTLSTGEEETYPKYFSTEVYKYNRR